MRCTGCGELVAMQCAARDAMRGPMRRYRRGELVAVAKNKVFIKPLALGRMGGRRVRVRMDVRGE